MRFTDVVRDVLQACLRLVPWPTEAGLRPVGDPGRESPVVVTGNYDLTVRRVVRALSGIDAWLVVAPSGGINVWCASAGGLLTTHQVVTALKTSGIEGRVSHRRAILPQLAATGVVGREVSRRCGWKVRFGPVYAEHIGAYLDAGSKKDESMRRVRFATRERLEMGAAWAFPTSLVLAVVLWFAQPAWALPVVAETWAISIACFLVYDRLGRGRWLVAWTVLAAAALALVTSAGGGAAAMFAAVASTAVILGVLTYDFNGSTPNESGSHFESERWHITLDPDRCAGVYSCWEVCPEACFEKREDVRKVDLAHSGRCVKCGACVVQCSQDALFFTDGDGHRIEPDVIRRYKLNLLGSRSVDTGTGDRAAAMDVPAVATASARLLRDVAWVCSETSSDATSCELHPDGSRLVCY